MLASAVVAAATFLSQQYGAPVMLFALLLGMAMNFLSADGPCAAGFAGREVLRIGVACAQILCPQTIPLNSESKSTMRPNAATCPDRLAGGECMNRTRRGFHDGPSNSCKMRNR